MAVRTCRVNSGCEQKRRHGKKNFALAPKMIHAHAPNTVGTSVDPTAVSHLIVEDLNRVAVEHGTRQLQVSEHRQNSFEEQQTLTTRAWNFAYDYGKCLKYFILMSRTKTGHLYSMNLTPTRYFQLFRNGKKTRKGEKKNEKSISRSCMPTCYVRINRK